MILNMKGTLRRRWGLNADLTAEIRIKELHKKEVKRGLEQHVDGIIQREQEGRY